jgi:CMP-N,N'-diacetyllegionaminic acid synthase
MIKSKDIVALIPARSGSERILNKNIKNLNGKPLIAHTIDTALKSGSFDKVVCATDSLEYAKIAESYGAFVPELRSRKISSSESSDIEWVDWIVKLLLKSEKYKFFSILRPTSPFRTISNINEAIDTFGKNLWADSLRSVTDSCQHPGKMWIIKNKIMTPVLPFSNKGVPWHSMQKKALSKVYQQNGCLEISKISNVVNDFSISGNLVIPFVMNKYEGHDINTEEDWIIAEHYLNSNNVNYE